MNLWPRRGIYIITNTVTGEQYVGKSINADKRIHGHRLALARGNHPNKRLRAACAIHGCAAFTFEIVELVPYEPGAGRNLDMAEARWMMRLAPAYNQEMSGYWGPALLADREAEAARQASNTAD